MPEEYKKPSPNEHVRIGTVEQRAEEDAYNEFYHLLLTEPGVNNVEETARYIAKAIANRQMPDLRMLSAEAQQEVLAFKEQADVMLNMAADTRAQERAQRQDPEYQAKLAQERQAREREKEARWLREEAERVDQAEIARKAIQKKPSKQALEHAGIWNVKDLMGSANTEELIEKSRQREQRRLVAAEPTMIVKRPVPPKPKSIADRIRGLFQ